jgi:hypothetical protein
MELESAVVDEGRLARAWLGFLLYQVKWYGEVDPLAGLNIGGTGLMPRAGLKALPASQQMSLKGGV